MLRLRFPAFLSATLPRHFHPSGYRLLTNRHKEWVRSSHLRYIQDRYSGRSSFKARYRLDFHFSVRNTGKSSYRIAFCKYLRLESPDMTIAGPQIRSESPGFVSPPLTDSCCT
jgi:hypothetical protein